MSPTSPVAPTTDGSLAGRRHGSVARRVRLDRALGRGVARRRRRIHRRRHRRPPARAQRGVRPRSSRRRRRRRRSSCRRSLSTRRAGPDGHRRRQTIGRPTDDRRSTRRRRSTNSRHRSSASPSTSSSSRGTRAAREVRRRTAGGSVRLMTDTSVASDVDDDSLFRRYAASRDRKLRNQIVERHLGLAAHIAQRFGTGRGPDDDLRQVAMLGLVKAVDRFDPDYGAAFSLVRGDHDRRRAEAVLPRSDVDGARAAVGQGAASRRSGAPPRNCRRRTVGARRSISWLSTCRSIATTCCAAWRPPPRTASARSTPPAPTTTVAVDRQGFLADDEVGFDQQRRSAGGRRPARPLAGA